MSRPSSPTWGTVTHSGPSIRPATTDPWADIGSANPENAARDGP